MDVGAKVERHDDGSVDVTLACGALITFGLNDEKPVGMMMEYISMRGVPTLMYVPMPPNEVVVYASWARVAMAHKQ